VTAVPGEQTRRRAMRMTPCDETQRAASTPTVASCPYLGHREASEKPHAYATRRNVCYARRGRSRAYSSVTREVQMESCLEPAGGWPVCRHFVAAMAEHRPPPHAVPEGGHSALVRRRSRRSSRLRSLRRRMVRRLGPLFWFFCIIAGSALLGILIARSSRSAW
jgi:hypothetical protein